MLPAFEVATDRSTVTIRDERSRMELPLEAMRPLDSFKEIFSGMMIDRSELIKWVGARALFEGSREAGLYIGQRHGDLWLRSVRAFFLPDGKVLTVETWKNHLFDNSFFGDSIRVYTSAREFERETAPYNLDPKERGDVVPFIFKQIRPPMRQAA